MNRSNWTLGCALVAFAAALIVTFGTRTSAETPSGADRAWWADTTGALSPPQYQDMQRSSLYVVMRDGVKLAIDVWLPKGLAPDTKLPAILEQTRYYRAAPVKSDPTGRCHPTGAAELAQFVKHAYAFVIVDVRGTGASFGTRSIEYSDDEVKDGSQIVDWIVRQSWSNGKVGSLGQSYAGTTSELLLRNQNPAVKAVLPDFSGYDFYDEIVSPGGIENTGFDWGWANANRQLDSASPSADSGIIGPCPVDEDRDGSMMKAAIAQHAGNFNLWEMLQHVRFRDDRYQGQTVDDASPYHFRDQIDAAHVPVYAIDGWYDAGYSLGAVRRFMTSRNPEKRLLLGPWNHGAHTYYAPGVHQVTAASFDVIGEKLRFFDYYLKGIDTGFSKEAPVNYFTTGINAWRSASSWPPPGIKPVVWCFENMRALGACGERSAEKSDHYALSGAADTGETNRWSSTVRPSPVFYPDRRDLDAQLPSYTSEPLASDTEVTGDPVLTLYVATDKPEADFCVYLEELSPAGEANYVTEGELRASRRKSAQAPYVNPGPYHSNKRKDRLAVPVGNPYRLDIVLLPMSHVFRQGTRVRVVLAPTDSRQFRDRSIEPVQWTVYRDAAHASHITLPTAAH